MVVQYTAMQHNLDDVLVGCDLGEWMRREREKEREKERERERERKRYLFYLSSASTGVHVSSVE